jgi:Sec-independent protein translocase protein TatA
MLQIRGKSFLQVHKLEQVMKRLGKLLSVVSVIAFVVLGTASLADAQRRNERQIRDLVRTLNAQIDDFQYGLDHQLRSTSTATRVVDDAHESIRNLQSRVDDFDESLTQKRENRDDVRSIISAAQEVDRFLVQNPQNQRIDSNWRNVRTTINSLASNYGVNTDWSSTANDPQTSRDNPRAPVINKPGIKTSRPTSGSNSALTGTYTLDAARSESTADIIANSGVAAGQRQDLESKLEAPEQIAIDVRGNQVTLASSKASPVTFSADGREKTEQLNGRTVRLRATLRGQELTITSLGGETDYTVTFTPSSDGRGMKVTRRITTDYLRETVFAESVYNKTDAYAGLGIDTSNTSTSDDSTYSSNDPNGPTPSISTARIGEFLVPAGTVITGLLESSVDTKVTQNNDRFKLTVQSPDEYRGATIEGYVSGVGRSGQISGRSNVTFNFETITMRDGKRYDFAGYLQTVKDQNGKEVRIDTEGTAKGDSQTRQAAKRGGIGAGLGAIIGAIAGGVKGAAIGAIIGGGAGAGTVVVQGRDDLQLMKGSTMTIQSTSPAGTGTTSRISDSN